MGSSCTVRRCRKRWKNLHERLRKWREAGSRRGVDLTRMAAAALIRKVGMHPPAGDSVRGISWKFEIRQTHALIGNLVGANARGRLESECSAIRDVIVFIHSVAANTKPADERAVAIQARAARKENDSALIRIRGAGLQSLRARIGDVHRI